MGDLARMEASACYILSVWQLCMRNGKLLAPRCRISLVGQAAAVVLGMESRLKKKPAPVPLPLPVEEGPCVSPMMAVAVDLQRQMPAIRWRSYCLLLETSNIATAIWWHLATSNGLDSDSDSGQRL